MFLSILTSIVSGRLYVGLGGNLNYSFLGYQLHHFYYGVSLLILAGILKLRKVPESLIFFVVVMIPPLQGGGHRFESGRAHSIYGLVFSEKPYNTISTIN